LRNAHTQKSMRVTSTIIIFIKIFSRIKNK